MANQQPPEAYNQPPLLAAALQATAMLPANPIVSSAWLTNPTVPTDGYLLMRPGTLYKIPTFTFPTRELLIQHFLLANQPNTLPGYDETVSCESITILSAARKAFNETGWFTNGDPEWSLPAVRTSGIDGTWALFNARRANIALACQKQGNFKLPYPPATLPQRQLPPPHRSPGDQPNQHAQPAQPEQPAQPVQRMQPPQDDPHRPEQLITHRPEQLITQRPNHPTAQPDRPAQPPAYTRALTEFEPIQPDIKRPGRTKRKPLKLRIQAKPTEGEISGKTYTSSIPTSEGLVDVKAEPMDTAQTLRGTNKLAMLAAVAIEHSPAAEAALEQATTVDSTSTVTSPPTGDTPTTDSYASVLIRNEREGP